MQSSIKHFVFDLDDTLYLERHYVHSGFRQVGEEIRNRFGFDHFAAHAWDLFENGQRRSIFDQALNKLGIPADPQLVQELVGIYRNHKPQISLEPDAVQCLETLAPQCSLALITDGVVESQKRKIEALDLHHSIPLRVLTWEWGQDYSKPHPRAFHTVQQQLNAVSSECVYVGDNPAKDFAAPKSLGWKTVRIRRPGGLHGHVDSGPYPPDYEVENLTPFTEVFGSRQFCLIPSHKQQHV
jgi:putative hydrolase of the HAD superfamily